ncbi:MAG: MBL fold metallo-hydrolase [Candidatus Omnitrophica bacterium]|nr:MBL fold metallo-hydrolase [Candidatus Omnitrophota bacterium]
MFIKKMVVGGMKANCYIFGDPETKEVFVIDPGGDYHRIRAVLDKADLKTKAIINTHGHIDHISANRYLGYPIWIHKDDAMFLQDSKKNLSSLFGFNLKSPPATRLLEEGETLEIGDISLEVIHTPGHTPGSICLKSDGLMFTGDILFYGGIGRSDFPHGSEKTLFESLKNKVLIHDDNTVIYPGHGPSTTIGEEKKSNPFL